MASIKKIKLPTVQNAYDLYGSPTAVLIATLAANATTVTFTNAAITNSCRFDVYTEDVFLPVLDIERSGTTITLTYEAQSSAVRVKLVVFEDDDSSYSV